MKPHNRKKLFLIPFGILACLALASYAVMLLWNALLPDILHVGTISYWQAAGIFILSKILFGFGGPRGGGAPWMRRKRMMEEHFRNMGPEERTKFKEQWRDRCNWGKRRWDWQEPKEEAKADN
ncbi:hypothetical protein DYU05_12620 [Mucilaginibacter terrenus]|uniref:DUF1682 domain-containing protein n=1 Tax=Mucilaginibacter terrenus TaxID=2482727 RepID=A0A3E2NPX3_9SPHI|nr:hypothetical protein [Mucilaginibacter terrenus]RFZ82991.1 hypothetical protein DYU05_12620 [Mucilaginibacter terrenus]